MRLHVLERELGKWLSLPEPTPRRRRLTKEEVAGFAVDGYLDYLYDRAGEEKAKAERLLAEYNSTPEHVIAQSILSWTEQLLTGRATARGQRMFRWLRARAPWELGRAYAIYRLFENEQWAFEELCEEYDYRRSAE
jgi:hypothetical protein